MRNVKIVTCVIRSLMSQKANTKTLLYLYIISCVPGLGRRCQLTHLIYKEMGPKTKGLCYF